MLVNLPIYFKMEESNEENTFQNEDKDVTKPETEDKIYVKSVEVTEEPPDIDLEKNVVENIVDIQGESKEEESQKTEIEPNTKPMSNHTEDEDNREAVGFKWSISCCYNPLLYIE